MLILIAEDNTVSRATLRGILELQEGWTVVEAEDGEAAWSKLDRGPRFNLCMLDISMPKIDGLALLKRMRGDKRFAHTPVMLITSDRQRSTVLTAANYNISAYIIKPYEPAKIVAQVMKLPSTSKDKDTTPILVTDPKEISGRFNLTPAQYIDEMLHLIIELRYAVDSTRENIIKGNALEVDQYISVMRDSCDRLGALRFRHTLDNMSSSSNLMPDHLQSLEVELIRLEQACTELSKRLNASEAAQGQG